MNSGAISETEPRMWGSWGWMWWVMREGHLRHSCPVCGTLNADALTEKGNTWEEMHKNASRPGHVLDLMTGICLVPA